MSKSTGKEKGAKRHTSLVISSAAGELSVTNGANGTYLDSPYRINPETPEEREKRLSEREALTLKVFKWAFENNNPKAE